MADKDKWDKLEIVIKFISSIVLVSIPIVIKYGADNISQSMQRGELIQSLTTQLVERDAKRDIALIALDAAIPEQRKCSTQGCQSIQDLGRLENDQVLKIAEVLVSRSIEDVRKKLRSPDPAEIKVARQIIIRRTDEKYYQDKYGKDFAFLTATVNNPISDQNLKSTPQEKEIKAQVSEVLSAIQPPPVQPTAPTPADVPDLTGIRLVYIQYQSNKNQAETLQKNLKAFNISVPEIVKVKTIKNNDIRYANAADRQLAERLKDFLSQKQGLKFDKLIDLSKAGYKVPSGQIEIWLKD